MLTARQIALTGFALGLGALAVALGSEHFLGKIPCAMCLAERWPYRFAMLAAIVAFAVPPIQRRPLLWVMAAVFAAAAAAAFVHVGVEQRWWPSPFPECTAPDLNGLSIRERLLRLPARPSKSCEDADYLIPFLPISMAQMNLLYALASAALIATLLRRGIRQETAQ